MCAKHGEVLGRPGLQRPHMLVEETRFNAAECPGPAAEVASKLIPGGSQEVAGIACGQQGWEAVGGEGGWGQPCSRGSWESEDSQTSGLGLNCMFSSSSQNLTSPDCQSPD